MSDTAIYVENLSKQYRINVPHRQHTTLRDHLVAAAETLFLPKRQLSNESGLIWALKGLSFEVKQGEVLGIIGRNGAGKSTLLKILSRITKPTGGRAVVDGRVGSLLEVGTGFHSELTGRENIYLNGAILGMTRAEIRARFDEIVAFAGVEKFIDTPVKRYSSGMYMRLAFAVAAHLESEILVVDEVLAVGDAEFQKKCLSMMKKVSRGGRTVLFVSHNIQAVSALCNKGLVLREGEIAFHGTARQAIQTYLGDINQAGNISADLHNAKRTGTGRARFERIEMSVGEDKARFPRTGENMCVNVLIRCHESIENGLAALVIYDSMGNRIIDVNTAMLGQNISMRAGEVGWWKFTFFNDTATTEIYTIQTYLGQERSEVIDSIETALKIEFQLDPEENHAIDDYPGVYRCRFDVCRAD